MGEKTRLILLENFSDTGVPLSTSGNQLLYGIYDNQLANDLITDFTNIQYHLDLSDIDQVTVDELQDMSDVNARALYYGVDEVPIVLMDGEIDPFKGNPQVITEVMIDSASLLTPVFDIQLDTISSGPETIQIRPSLTANETFTRPVIFNVAVVEKSIITGNEENRNVFKKLLYNGNGLMKNIAWSEGMTEPMDEATWIIDRPISDNNGLALVAWVQDKLTKVIYQATYLPLNYKRTTTVTGINELILNEVKEIEVYPNPVVDVLNFRHFGDVNRPYTWEIIDQRGVLIQKGTIDFSEGHYSVETREMPNGIYILRIGMNEQPLVHKKLVIMNGIK